MRSRHLRAGLLARVALAVPAIAGATDPPAVPETEAELDAELLEFLGTVDGLDEEWTEYLAKTDIAKLVKAKSTPKDESND